MREAAGLSIKSAVSHSYMRDTRDDALLGTRGSYVKLSHELAGLGGDARFYKAEGAGQLARRLLPGVVSGFVLPWVSPAHVQNRLCHSRPGAACSGA